MVKLTDKDKKKIIADYIATNSYSETARINNVVPNTVKNIVLKNPEVANICKEKNEENTKDILEYMKNNSKKQIRVIELSLEAMEKKLENIDMFTSLKDVATVYGVLYDKVIKCKELELKEKELSFKNNAEQDILDKLDNLLEEQKKSYGGNDAKVD